MNESDLTLRQIERHLRPLPRAARRVVLAELQASLKPELLPLLGPPREVARSLMDGWQSHWTAHDYQRLALRKGLEAAGVVFVLGLGLMLANMVYLYTALLATLPGGSWVPLQLWLLNLPAIAVVLAAPAALAFGLAAPIGLARRTGPAVFRRHLPRVLGAALLAATLGAGVAFALNELVVPPTNRAVVDLVNTQILQKREAAQQRRSPQELSSLELAGRMDAEPLVTAEDRRAMVFKLVFPASVVALTLLGLALGLLGVQAARLKGLRSVSTS